MRQGSLNRLSNKQGSLSRPFRSNGRANPSASPFMFHVFRKRGACHPKRFCTIGYKDNAATGRDKLRRTYFLAIVVLIRQSGGNRVGTIRHAPAHKRPLRKRTSR